MAGAKRIFCDGMWGQVIENASKIHGLQSMGTNFLRWGHCRECGQTVNMDEKTKIPDREIWECDCGYPNNEADLCPIYSAFLPDNRRLLLLEI